MFCDYFTGSKVCLFHQLFRRSADNPSPSLSNPHLPASTIIPVHRFSSFLHPITDPAKERHRHKPNSAPGQKTVDPTLIPGNPVPPGRSKGGGTASSYIMP